MGADGFNRWANQQSAAAFGIDDAGRILCYVADSERKKSLALLVPR
jgi:hypothetical protein